MSGASELAASQTPSAYIGAGNVGLSQANAADVLINTTSRAQKETAVSFVSVGTDPFSNTARYPGNCAGANIAGNYIWVRNDWGWFRSTVVSETWDGSAYTVIVIADKFFRSDFTVMAIVPTTTYNTKHGWDADIDTCMQTMPWVLADRLRIGNRPGATGNSMQLLLTNTKSVDFNAIQADPIPAGATRDYAITVTGVPAGHMAVVVPQVKLSDGITVDYCYTALNTIHVVISNRSSGDLSLATKTIKYFVVQ